MKLLIRNWKPEDLPSLIELNRQWGYETSEGLLSKQLERINQMENAAVYVAEVDGQVGGRIFIMEHITLGSEGFTEVHGLVVDEKFRRSGIGKCLIEKARQWSREKGFSVMKLRTNTKRTEANLFYPSIGFIQEKQQNIFSIET